jgi:hypothetical protein
VPDRQALAPKLEKTIPVKSSARSPKTGTSTPSCGNPGTNSLYQNAALELAHGRHDVQEQLSARARGVERLGGGHERDVVGGEVVEHHHHVPQGSEQPVRAPDDDGIELPVPRIPKKAIKPWPTISCAAHAVVFVRLGEPPSPRLDEGRGLVVLQRRVLLDLAYPQIPPDPKGAHCGTTSRPPVDQPGATRNRRRRRPRARRVSRGSGSRLRPPGIIRLRHVDGGHTVVVNGSLHGLQEPQHVGKVTTCECACIACRNSTIDDLAMLVEAHEREAAELRKLYELAVKPG